MSGGITGKNISLGLTPQNLHQISLYYAAQLLVSSREKNNKVQKVTILPIGERQGMISVVSFLEESAKTVGFFLNEIDSLIAGRVAEEVVLGEGNISTLGEADLKRASKIAASLYAETFYFGIQSQSLSQYAL